MRVRRKSEITAELQVDGNWLVRDNGAQRYMSPATFAELYEPVPEPPVLLKDSVHCSDSGTWCPSWIANAKLPAAPSVSEEQPAPDKRLIYSPHSEVARAQRGCSHKFLPVVKGRERCVRCTVNRYWIDAEADVSFASEVPPAPHRATIALIPCKNHENCDFYFIERDGWAVLDEDGFPWTGREAEAKAKMESLRGQE